jgi:hypothetical protein
MGNRFSHYSRLIQSTQIEVPLFKLIPYHPLVSKAEFEQLNCHHPRAVVQNSPLVISHLGFHAIGSTSKDTATISANAAASHFAQGLRSDHAQAFCVPPPL